MSENTETIVVCPDDEGELVDTFAIVIGVLTVIGSIIAYFMQQSKDRKDAAEAKIKEDAALDREQGLERVRKQLSILVGPMHRLWKAHNTIIMQWRRQSGHGYEDYSGMMTNKGQAYWITLLSDDFLGTFIEDPDTFEAVMYRNLISRRIKPIDTMLRELILNHMSDLADMPTQVEWLNKYGKDDITSPHTGSMNINVIFDSFVAWSLEFDDIVESWSEGDFRRMQPTTRVAFLICNNLIDLLYDNAKEKEARYNHHVTVHKNTIQMSIEAQVKQGYVRNNFMKEGHIRHMLTEDDIEDYIENKNETAST
jgi:hypothetical protein